MMKWMMSELVGTDTLLPGRRDRLARPRLYRGSLPSHVAKGRRRRHRVRLVRTNPRDPLSFDTEKSDIIITTHPTMGKYVRLAIHTDKNAVLGRPRYAYIPAYTRIGLNFVGDLTHYLNAYPVPDGYLFTAPYNKRGQSFRSTPYTAWDAVLHRCYTRAFPDGKKVFASHRCRKSVIQAIFNTGLPKGIIGDIVGWLSVKSTVLKYHASLSVDHALSIIACICHLVTLNDTTSTVAPP